jgi:hypothetical protein
LIGGVVVQPRRDRKPYGLVGKARGAVKGSGSQVSSGGIGKDNFKVVKVLFG